MPIQTVTHLGKIYPKFQSEGFAARFAIPFAREVCKGIGVDIGCNRAEWALPFAIPVDPAMNEWDAYNLPSYLYEGEIKHEQFDYIFSSHCLEHLPDWVKALDYWYSKIKSGGVLFLYLPDHSQSYWRPWSNRKHLHCFTPEIIASYFEDQPNKWKLAFVSSIDLNNSFMVIAEKL